MATGPNANKQQGYAMLTLAILLMIIGVMSAGAMNISNTSENLASNAIQRNRAFQAADAATYGIHTVPESNVLGVVTPPKYSIEQVGDYVSDGGTGVVNLDIGGAAYGRMTSGGREIILYNVQSHANGSFNEVKTVVETAVAYSY